MTEGVNSPENSADLKAILQDRLDVVRKYQAQGIPFPYYGRVFGPIKPEGLEDVYMFVSDEWQDAEMKGIKIEMELDDLPPARKAAVAEVIANLYPAEQREALKKAIIDETRLGVEANPEVEVGPEIGLADFFLTPANIVDLASRLEKALTDNPANLEFTRKLIDMIAKPTAKMKDKEEEEKQMLAFAQDAWSAIDKGQALVGQVKEMAEVPDNMVEVMAEVCARSPGNLVRMLKEDRFIQNLHRLATEREDAAAVFIDLPGFEGVTLADFAKREFWQTEFAGCIKKLCQAPDFVIVHGTGDINEFIKQFPVFPSGDDPEAQERANFLRKLYTEDDILWPHIQKDSADQHLCSIFAIKDHPFYSGQYHKRGRVFLSPQKLAGKTLVFPGDMGSTSNQFEGGDDTDRRKENVLDIPHAAVLFALRHIVQTIQPYSSGVQELETRPQGPFSLEEIEAIYLYPGVLDGLSAHTQEVIKNNGIQLAVLQEPH